MHKRLASLAVLALLAAPAGANGFAPGEETVFRITYLSLPTGEGRIVVGKPEGDIWPVIFQAKTEGVAGLSDIREHLVSYWDTRTKLTRGSDLKAYEVGDFHQDSARFDRDRGQATVTVHRKGKKKEKTIDVPGRPHGVFYDHVAAVLAGREAMRVTPQSVREVMRVIALIRKGTNFPGKPTKHKQREPQMHADRRR